MPTWKPIPGNHPYIWGTCTETANRLYDEFIRKNNIVKTADMNYFLELLMAALNDKRVYGCISDGEHIPFADHGRLFKRSDGAVAFVFHPYRRGSEMESTLLPWAKTHGLKASIYDKDKSFYSPGETSLVIITLPEVDFSI